MGSVGSSSWALWDFKGGAWGAPCSRRAAHAVSITKLPSRPLRMAPPRISRTALNVRTAEMMNLQTYFMPQYELQVSRADPPPCCKQTRQTKRWLRTCWPVGHVQGWNAVAAPWNIQGSCRVNTGGAQASPALCIPPGHGAAQEAALPAGGMRPLVIRQAPVAAVPHLPAAANSRGLVSSNGAIPPAQSGKRSGQKPDTQAHATCH